MQIVEYRPSAQVITDPLANVLPDRLKQRMTRRDPFQSCVLRQKRFVEYDLLILVPKLSEPAFEPFANGI